MIKRGRGEGCALPARSSNAKWMAALGVSDSAKMRSSLGSSASVMKSKVVWNQTNTARTMKHNGRATGDDAR
ncbi:MAG: hypothetical protein E6J73_19710 [Deltaproteobacteria bacterium]|nr:MAG: hypothetical protein E6J73_19710 [Deltaproteobacteria bacterium]